MAGFIEIIFQSLLVAGPVLYYLFKVERRLTRIETMLTYCPSNGAKCLPSSAKPTT